MKNTHFKHLMILLGVNCFWGPLCMMFKYASISLSPQAVVVTRWAGISMLLWIFISFPKTQKHFKISWKDILKTWPALIIGFFFVGPSQSLSLYALQFTSSIEASALNSTEPILATLLAIIMIREYINVKGGIALVIGLLGTYIITIGFQLPVLKEDSAMGNLLYFGAMFIEALSLVLSKFYFKNTKGILIVLWYAIGCFLSSITLPLLLPTYIPLIYNSMTLLSTLGLFYLIVVAGCFCFISWYHFVPFTPINIMSISTGIQPLIAVLLGILFMKERLTLEVGIGILCILISIGIASITEHAVINYLEKFRIKKLFR